VPRPPHRGHTKREKLITPYLLRSTLLCPARCHTAVSKVTFRRLPTKHRAAVPDEAVAPPCPDEAAAPLCPDEAATPSCRPSTRAPPSGERGLLLLPSGTSDGPPSTSTGSLVAVPLPWAPVPGSATRRAAMGASAPESAGVALPWSFHAGTNKEEMEGCEEEVLLLPLERTARPLSLSPLPRARTSGRRRLLCCEPAQLPGRQRP
jgi:hypothetical protein